MNETSAPQQRYRAARKCSGTVAHETCRISREAAADIIARQRWLCMCCGGRRKTENSGIDHIEPIARGGSNDESNLQAICKPCNARKRASRDGKFRERYRGLLPQLKPGEPLVHSCLLRTDKKRLDPRGLQGGQARLMRCATICSFYCIAIYSLLGRTSATCR